MEERGKILENECSDLEWEFFNYEEYFRRDEKFLDEKKGKLKGLKIGCVVNVVIFIVGIIFCGILIGGVEVVVGVVVGGIIVVVIEKDIKKFEEDVSRVLE